MSAAVDVGVVAGLVGANVTLREPSPVADGFA